MTGAGESKQLSLPNHIFLLDSTCELLLTVSLRLKSATAWADAGHEVAWSQHSLPTNKVSSILTVTSQVSYNLQVHSTKHSYQISGSNFSLKFDRIRGYITEWTSAGRQLFAPDSITQAALVPSFWRPPTDNDRPHDFPYWQRFGLDSMTSQLRSFTASKDQAKGTVQVKTHTYLSPPVLSWGFHVYTSYTISSTSSLAIHIHIKPVGPHPRSVPRIGLNIHLPRSLNNAKWFGLGPGESYPDKKTSQKLGIWSSTVPELQTRYDVPQENGNRMETRWVKLLDVGGSGIKAVRVGGGEGEGKDIFSWAASHHSAATLERAGHPHELVEENATLWRLDAAVAGVGSAACGPGVAERFQVGVGEMEFGFVFERV